MSTDDRWDVLVLGGGVLGAAVYQALCARGARAALVERGVVASGCTAYSGGVVRVFHANDTLIELAAQSHAWYLDFERHTGVPAAFVRTGFLYFPAPGQEQACQDRVARLSGRLGLQWWDTARVHAEFPQIRGTSPAVYEPEAGYMSPPDVTRALVGAAERQGGQVFTGTGVHRLARARGRTVGVETSHGLMRADRVVVALGAHTPSFLDRHGIAHGLWSQRIQVDVHRVDAPRGQHPAWIDDEHDLNGRPHGDASFLLGYPTQERVLDQDAAPSSAAHGELIAHMGRLRFAWADVSRRVGSFTSCDAYSADGCGIAGFVDEARTLAVVSGFSGGGFKLAPALAHRICNELTES